MSSFPDSFLWISFLTFFGELFLLSFYCVVLFVFTIFIFVCSNCFSTIIETLEAIVIVFAIRYDTVSTVLLANPYFSRIFILLRGSFNSGDYAANQEKNKEKRKWKLHRDFNFSWREREKISSLSCGKFKGMKKEARKEGRHQKKEGSMKDRKKERTLARNEGKRQGTNEQTNEQTPKERKIATQFLPRLVSLTWINVQF